MRLSFQSRPCRYRRRCGSMPDVQPRDSMATLDVEVPQLRPRSPLSVWAAASQPGDTGGDEIRTVPCVPLSHPFVERLIGTLRRECLDRALFWTTADLESKLLYFETYFNHHRTHRARAGRPPDGVPTRSVVNLQSYRWESHCRGLYQTPIAA